MSNIKQTTEQLIELAKVLNEFKSEAVQIRLLELLFDQKIMQPVGQNEPVEDQPAKESTKVETIQTPTEKKSAKQELTKTEEKIEKPESQKVITKKRAKKELKKETKKVAEKAVRTRSTTRPGPSIILKQLIDNKFFADSRNIGDVVDYCKKMYNYEYKSTDLSGTLAKYSKIGKLNRTKNPDTNQFEYTLPQ